MSKQDTNGRKQAVIAVRGLDTATSGAAVPDGACGRLHNLRRQAGEWRGVCAPKKTAEVTAAGERIVCRHAALPENEYITRQGRFIYHSRLSGGAFAHRAELFTCSASGEGDPRTACHGNVLQISDRELDTVFEKTWVYDPAAGTYAAFDMNAIAPPRITALALNAETAETAEIDAAHAPGHASTRIARILSAKDNPENILEREFLYNTYLDTSSGIPGTFLLFLAYKMFDGSVVKAGALHEIRYAAPDAGSFYLRTSYDNDVRIADYYAPVTAVSPTVTFAVDPKVKDSPLFTKVAVYATRNTPPYLWDELEKKWNAEPAETLYDNRVIGSGGLTIRRYDAALVANSEAGELPETPFYEIAELDPGETAVTLTYDGHFRDIETGKIYSANYSCHRFAALDRYYYNNRLHAYGVQFTFAAPTVRLPYETDAPREAGVRTPIAGGTFYIQATLNAEGRRFTVQATQSAYTFVDEDGKGRIFLPALLSYPDARAERMEIYIGAGGRWHRLLSAPLKAAYANNMAYACNGTTEIAADGLTETVRPPMPENRCPVNNKIYVSKADNMFYFDPKHVIAVDAEEIRGLATGTEQLSEGRFGDYPLHIFTESGVFVAESGQDEVLYGRVVPLCRDVLRRGAPTAAVQGRVAFVTGAGIMALEGRRSLCLSLPLHDAGHAFETYLAGADTLLWLPVYDELLVHNPAYRHAYVCALQEGVWSTRDFAGGKTVGPGLLSMPGGLYTTTEPEDPSLPLAPELRTRPLKLGSFGPKRIDVLAARLRARNFTVRLEGSNDLQNWESMRVATGERIRRTPNSYRYFRIAVGALAEPFALSSFEIEFYERFARHIW